MKLTPIAAASLSLVFAIAACGSDSNSGGGGVSGTGGGSSTGKGGTSSKTGSYTGCINGDGFACKTSDALEACFNKGTCADCSPDASACETTGKGGTSSGKGGTGGTGGSGTPTKKETGKQCQENDECLGEACIVDGNADFGYCTNVCEDFPDCPTFWECKKVGNASSKYCVQNQ